MRFFGKKKPETAPAGNGNGDANGSAPAGDAPASDKPHRDISKAARFFEHGRTQSDARNFDYAIDMYISGLKHNPDQQARHEELHEIAKKRKVSGGKPLGKLEVLRERMAASKDPVDKMLAIEKVWSKDPFNLDVMIDLMELSCAADKAEPELMIREFTWWLGSLVLDAKLTNKALTSKDFIRVMKLLREVEAHKQAIEACKSALMLNPSDQTLIQTLKDLETEITIQQGGYNNAGKEKSYKTSQVDADAQKKRELDDQIVKTDTQLETQIKNRREEFAKKPDDYDLGTKLVDSLLEKPTDALEAEAIDILEKLYKSSGQYRFRARVGDIKMKQLARKADEIKKRLDAAPQDAEVAAEFKAFMTERYKFELDEYAERVREYPTENLPRFEYGRRLMFFKRYDEAIGELQLAKKDAKVRARAYQCLGDCFRIQGYLDEAIDTLKQGLSEQVNKLDKESLTLQYLLMDSLERSAIKNNKEALAREALQVASAILQADIKFKDIRTRMENLRKLVAKMSASPGDANGGGEPKPA